MLPKATTLALLTLATGLFSLVHWLTLSLSYTRMCRTPLWRGS